MGRRVGMGLHERLGLKEYRLAYVHQTESETIRDPPEIRAAFPPRTRGLSWEHLASRCID